MPTFLVTAQASTSEWDTAIWMVAALVLGALGLFLALPGGRADLSRVGLVLLAAAGGVLLVLAARLLPAEATTQWFAVCALVAVFGAVRMITHRKPVYSALYFVLVILSVAALLLLMQAEFLAAALVIVYAGAILVTYLFVIMLAQQAYLPAYDTQSRDPLWGCVGGFALLAVITMQLFLGPTDSTVAFTAQSAASAVGNETNVGTPLLTRYVIGIQIAGVLLLAAMVGAIAIARRQIGTVAEPLAGEGED
ncbi:MAG: NADH-quinone oxidoreductase subunit J [Phycisphaerales bacterium]|nr:NADH-quinone oxidoreductase subunit J [Phycisphaerales bacterium]